MFLLHAVPRGRRARVGAALPHAAHRAAAALHSPRTAWHGHSTTVTFYLTVASFSSVLLRGIGAGLVAPAALAWAWSAARHAQCRCPWTETCSGSRISALGPEKVLSFGPTRYSGRNPTVWEGCSMVCQIGVSATAILLLATHAVLYGFTSW